MSDAGDVLREARRRHGLDQATLARRACTSQAQISRIERGTISPGVATLSRLLHAMGEQLVLDARPAPHGNGSTAELRATLAQTSAQERVAQAVELSRFLTTLAAGSAAGAEL
jgi:transcriptional regulator with XRE-family HTH domain